MCCGIIPNISMRCSKIFTREQNANPSRQDEVIFSQPTARMLFLLQNMNKTFMENGKTSFIFC